VEAASRHFFGISASKLNLPQAATLAGLVQLPSQTDPIRSPARALARRNVVLDRMRTLNLISNDAWQKAKKTKLVTKSLPGRNTCALSPYPYFCEYIKNWLLEQPSLGKTRAERQKRVNRGGLTIQTTLDPKIQKITQDSVDAKIPAGNSDRIGAAAAVIEPGTGNVLAIAQNTKYAINNGNVKPPWGKTTVNWAVDQRYGNSIGFAFGSTAKMFAVAEALRSGMPIDSTVVARASGPKSPAIFTSRDYHDNCKVPPGQAWGVRNDEDTANGPIPLTVATAKSVNTAFAVLVSKLGGCKVRDMMTNLGLHQSNGRPIADTGHTPPDKYPSVSDITLGSGSVSPLTLASAYNTIASGGTYCIPSPVLTITASDKKPIALDKNRCHRAVDPDVANGVTQILKTVLTKGTAAGIGGLAGGRPAAGKTGTSDGSNETWFVGYTPQLTTAVWVGTPDGDPERVLRNLNLGGTSYGGQVFGATVAAPTWKLIMDGASAGMPVLDFAGPGSMVQSGDMVPIPNVTGMTASDARSALSAAEFSPIIGGAVTSSYPVGTVVSTSPSLKALRGSRVVILTSAGYTPPKPSASAKSPVKAPRLPKCRPGGPRPCRR